MNSQNARYHAMNIGGGIIAVPLAVGTLALLARTNTDACVDQTAAAAVREADNSNQVLHLQLEAFASTGSCQLLRAATEKAAHGIGTAFDEAPTTNPKDVRSFSWRFKPGQSSTSAPVEAAYHMDVVGKGGKGPYPIDPKAVDGFSIGYKSPAGYGYYGIGFSRSGEQGNEWTIAVSGNNGMRAFSTNPNDSPTIPVGISPDIKVEPLDDVLLTHLTSNVQRLVQRFERGTPIDGLPVPYPG